MARSALAPAVAEMSLSGSGARGMVSLIFTCAGVINGAAARGQEERGVTSAGLPAGLLSSPPSNEAAQHPNNNIFPPHEGSRVILWRGDGGGGF